MSIVTFYIQGFLLCLLLLYVLHWNPNKLFHFLCVKVLCPLMDNIIHDPLFYTGKNNGFPFLDILGYLKNTHKNPKFGKVRQVPTYSLNTLISKNGNPLFFPMLPLNSGNFSRDTSCDSIRPVKTFLHVNRGGSFSFGKIRSISVVTFQTLSCSYLCCSHGLIQCFHQALNYVAVTRLK